jgi:Fe-S cluster assembly protein SufD
MPRVHLFLGEGAKMTWIATDEGMGWTNRLIDIFLAETSELTLYSSLKNFTGWHFDHVRAHLKKGSHFSSCSLQFPEGIARSSYRVILAGEESACELQGLWNLDQETQVHIHAHVEHRAPHTKSLQKFKGILDDSSKSSFEGKIYVHPEAQKTEAYQLCNHMILGPGAIGNAKPNLEIFADDVKASHGATMAQLSDEELFYLRSRGIALDDAKRLLIDSFSQDILSGVPYATLLP